MGKVLFDLDRFQILSKEKRRELARYLLEEIYKHYFNNYDRKRNLIKKEKISMNGDFLQAMLSDILYCCCQNKYEGVLSCIDFTGISFDGVDIQCANLKGTNAEIDPQTVMERSLCRTNLEGIDMSGKSFDGVDIREANLKGTNAEIDPQTVMEHSLYGTNLEEIDMSGKSFDEIDIQYANLKGTHAEIDPQTVMECSLCGTNLEGIDMSGKSFDGIDIKAANLKGTNADIDPQKVSYLLLNGANLTGLDLHNCDFKGVSICGSILTNTGAHLDYATISTRPNDVSGCIVMVTKEEFDKLDKETLNSNVDVQIIDKNEYYIYGVDSAKQYIKSLF